MAQEDQPPRINIKIRSFSDLVFGLALSIGSIVLLSRPFSSITDVEVNVLDFGFSFVIIVFTWIGYSRTMAVLQTETSVSLYLNIVLLFLAAIEPYLFYILVSANIQLVESFSVPYGLNVGAIFLVQGGLARLVIIEDKQNESLGRDRLHPELIAQFRRVTISDVIIGIAFLVSTLPYFWVPIGPTYLRFLIWFSSLSTFFVVRGVSRKPKIVVKQTSP
jgi:uncharacterized membrane protein